MQANTETPSSARPEAELPVELSVDIEITNRCNATCHFCPRDRTPHQGLMQPDLFDIALGRAIEYRKVANDRLGLDLGVSICGLGEPLINKNAADYVSRVRSAGIQVTMSSNASLLDERRGQALLDAGLQKIFINVGETGEDYERVYGLPFERTMENVLRFNEMSDGQCAITMVLVDHRADAAHIAEMTRFWTEHGLNNCHSYEVMNRGGSLFVDHMQYETFDELEEAKRLLTEQVGSPLCGAPFLYLFIGYDGKYYLCCSDWEKQAPMGHVTDLSFLDVTSAKLDHLVTRDPVCRTCNFDPINRLTEVLRAERQGHAPQGSGDQVLAELVATNNGITSGIRDLGHSVPPAPKARHRIPVRVE